MIVMAIDLASGIVISEVELNPEGKDPGNEWVELYSEDEIDLNDFSLENNDGDEEELTGSFSGYFVFEFDSQWLDNKDEKVILKEDDDEIHQSPTFDDGANDRNAWSFCDGEWEFVRGSKGEENNCPGDEEKDESEEIVERDFVEEDKVEDVEVLDDVVEKVEKFEKVSAEKIVLNSPVVSEESVEEFVSKDEKLRKWMLFAFLAFLVILIVLLAFRRL